MKARDVMTARVISIETDAPIMRAVRLMLQNRISGLPVVGPEGELVGMVTEGDFLRRGEIGTQRRRNRWLDFLIGPGRLADEYVHARGRKVEEVMTREPVTVSEDTSLDEVVRVMERHRIKRLPVLRDRKVVGIVTRANIMHALVSLAAETAFLWSLRSANTTISTAPRYVFCRTTTSKAPQLSVAGLDRTLRASICKGRNALKEQRGCYVARSFTEIQVT